MVVVTSSENLATVLLDAMLSDNINKNINSRRKTEQERISEQTDIINCGDYVEYDEDIFSCTY